MKRTVRRDCVNVVKPTRVGLERVWRSSQQLDMRVDPPRPGCGDCRPSPIRQRPRPRRVRRHRPSMGRQCRCSRGPAASGEHPTSWSRGCPCTKGARITVPSCTRLPRVLCRPPSADPQPVINDPSPLGCQLWTAIAPAAASVRLVTRSKSRSGNHTCDPLLRSAWRIDRNADFPQRRDRKIKRCVSSLRVREQLRVSFRPRL